MYIDHQYAVTRVWTATLVTRRSIFLGPGFIVPWLDKVQQYYHYYKLIARKGSNLEICTSSVYVQHQLVVNSVHLMTQHLSYTSHHDFAAYSVQRTLWARVVSQLPYVNVELMNLIEPRSQIEYCCNEMNETGERDSYTSSPLGNSTCNIYTETSLIRTEQFTDRSSELTHLSILNTLCTYGVDV